WGGRFETDGNNSQIVPHGNCQNTPIEIFETRYPWVHSEYRLNPDGGGPGRTRGGLGITRVMSVEADEVVASALCDRSKVSPSGGGYGPPWERPIERVLADVESGFVSVEHAHRDYGVAIRDDGTVDEATTSALRREMADGVG